MINLIDYILDLFRDESHAQAFVANPDQALADAGLSTVSSAQLQSVAATAIPSLAMGGSGDASRRSAAGRVEPLRVRAQLRAATDFSPSTDLASNNSFMSPTTNITDDHSVSFGMGDITLGDKTTAQGNGAVAVGGSTHGDIVSGDGAVLGNGNTVNNGDIHTGPGSTVAVGDGNTISEGNTSAGGDVLSSHDGTRHPDVGPRHHHGFGWQHHQRARKSDHHRHPRHRQHERRRQQLHAHPHVDDRQLPARFVALVFDRGHLGARQHGARQLCARQLRARHVATRQFDPRDNPHRHRPGRAPRLLTLASEALPTISAQVTFGVRPFADGPGRS